MDTRDDEAKLAAQLLDDQKKLAAHDRNAALALTAKIKANLAQGTAYFAEAYNLKTWHVLGYATWEAYVETEFGMSRSHSYRLLWANDVNTELSVVLGFKVEVPEGALRGVDVAELIKEAEAAVEKSKPQTQAQAQDTAAQVAKKTPRKAVGRSGGRSRASSRTKAPEPQKVVRGALDNAEKQKAQAKSDANFLTQFAKSLSAIPVERCVNAAKNATPKAREGVVAALTAIRDHCVSALESIEGSTRETDPQISDEGGSLGAPSGTTLGAATDNAQRGAQAGEKRQRRARQAGTESANT